MPGPVRKATLPITVRALLATALFAPGCKEDDPRSDLERRASKQDDGGGRSTPDETKDEGKQPAESADTKSVANEDGPAPDAEKVELKLALEDDLELQVQTIGSVRLPLVQEPVGFAREERIRLSGCTGESFARTCTLEHRHTNYESELPAGRFLKADEARVAGLITRHSLAVTGARSGTTEVEGPKDKLESEHGKALVDVHRFYCLRFPEEPIAVGAKWQDSCKMRTGGVVTTREMQWELSELTDDPSGAGKRAELRGIGRYSAPGKKGPRTGTVQAVLYFYVDLGFPHILKEYVAVDVHAQKGLQTVTTLHYQFAKVVPGKPEKVVQVTGKPFDGAKLSGEALQGPLAPPEDAVPDQPGKKKPD